MAKAKTASGTKTEAETKSMTEYVILEQREWRPSPDDREDWRDPAPAWVSVATVTAASKTAAIRQHTGDGADVVEGAWKAVPLSSWKGGEQTKRITASERMPLEDALT